MTKQRRMKVEAANGGIREIDVFPLEETTWVGGEVLLLSDGRRIRVTGEIWNGGAVSGDLLLEKVAVRNGSLHRSYAVAKRLPTHERRSPPRLARPADRRDEAVS